MYKTYAEKAKAYFLLLIKNNEVTFWKECNELLVIRFLF
jgi:hypothetical protein